MTYLKGSVVTGLRSAPFDRQPETNATGFWSTAWAGYTACIWALVFAAISFYWAAGGTAGSSTIGPAITGLAHDPGFVAVLWGTGVLKIIGGLHALSLVQFWSRIVPRMVLLSTKRACVSWSRVIRYWHIRQWQRNCD